MHLHLPKLPKPARLLPITLALVAVLAVASGVAFAAHLAAQAGIGASAPQPGTAAIDVTLPGQVPAFTAADVRAYYTASKGFPGLRTPDFKAPPIESITFMSAGQAEATIMHHGSLGSSANALVCVVAVGGPVIRVGKGGVGRLTIPGTPTDTPAPTPIAVPAGTVVAYMIFDASTGNLLAYGG